MVPKNAREVYKLNSCAAECAAHFKGDPATFVSVDTSYKRIRHVTCSRACNLAFGVVHDMSAWRSICYLTKGQQRTSPERNPDQL